MDVSIKEAEYFERFTCVVLSIKAI